MFGPMGNILTFRLFEKDKPVRLKRGSKAYRALRLAVLERDNNICQQCNMWNENPPHHVIKVSQGGSDTLDNMICLCTYCHDKYPNWKRRVE